MVFYSFGMKHLKIWSVVCFLLVDALGLPAVLAYGGGGGGGGAYHGECVSGVCTQVWGSGLNTCYTNSDCPGSGTTTGTTGTTTTTGTGTTGTTGTSGTTGTTGTSDTGLLSRLLQKMQQYEDKLLDEDIVSANKVVGKRRVTGQERVTRGQLIKVLVQVDYGDSIPAATAAPFRDVPLDHPYVTYIAYAKQIGWVHGYLDGTFAPNRMINRVEALKVILLTQFARSEIRGGVMTFVDCLKGQWYEPFVAFAQSNLFIYGAVDAQGRRYFRPADIISRSEVGSILKRILRSKDRQGDANRIDEILKNI